MSDHSVSCTIYNETSDGDIALASDSPNSGTSWANTTTDANGNIVSGFASGSSGGFTASGSAMSGCGGSATYTLPNNDLLVILYNTSTGDDNAYCIALLQSGSGNKGTSSYYCTTDSTIATLDDDSITVSISVYPL